ncbi:MAG: V-type ATP synthase subunit D [Acidobacteria bacterium]|nr:V-type ATP synthase subunit D [Acidobacteriota bacterium]
MPSLSGVRTTRAELVATRHRIALARRGCELLEEKRNALWKEFRRSAEQAIHDGTQLEQIAGAAALALSRAVAVDGPPAVQSAALAPEPQPPLEISTVNVMGVRVPLIGPIRFRRSLLGRGYSLSTTSTRIDAAAAAFEEQLEKVVQLAATEMRLRCLADEIRRTNRLIHTFEQVLLPRLEKTRDQIQLILDERQREELLRIRKFQLKIQRP